MKLIKNSLILLFSAGLMVLSPTLGWGADSLDSYLDHANKQLEAIQNALALATREIKKETVNDKLIEKVLATGSNTLKAGKEAYALTQEMIRNRSLAPTISPDPTPTELLTNLERLIKRIQTERQPLWSISYEQYLNLLTHPDKLDFIETLIANANKDIQNLETLNAELFDINIATKIKKLKDDNDIFSAWTKRVRKNAIIYQRLLENSDVAIASIRECIKKVTADLHEYTNNNQRSFLDNATNQLKQAREVYRNELEQMSEQFKQIYNNSFSDYLDALRTEYPYVEAEPYKKLTNLATFIRDLENQLSAKMSAKK
jgi:hypothetical protein